MDDLRIETELPDFAQVALNTLAETRDYLRGEIDKAGTIAKRTAQLHQSLGFVQAEMARIYAIHGTTRVHVPTSAEIRELAEHPERPEA